MRAVVARIFHDAVKRRAIAKAFALMTAVSFAVVASLSIACAFHHGIDGSGKPRKASDSLFCLSLSKLSQKAPTASSGHVPFYSDSTAVYFAQPQERLDSAVTKARSRAPPSFSIQSSNLWLRL